jgi:hypothetical protein
MQVANRRKGGLLSFYIGQNMFETWFKYFTKKRYLLPTMKMKRTIRGKYPASELKLDLNCLNY